MIHVWTERLVTEREAYWNSEVGGLSSVRRHVEFRSGNVMVVTCLSFADFFFRRKRSLHFSSSHRALYSGLSSPLVLVRSRSQVMPSLTFNEP